MHLILLCTYLFMQSSLISGAPPLPSQASVTTKKNSSRRNAWGNLSYADLITQAITSAQDSRLTLSQIYEWMVQNVPYFKDKGDSNSSAGWKVGAVEFLILLSKFSIFLSKFGIENVWWHIRERNICAFCFCCLLFCCFIFLSYIFFFTII